MQEVKLSNSIPGRALTDASLQVCQIVGPRNQPSPPSHYRYHTHIPWRSNLHKFANQHGWSMAGSMGKFASCELYDVFQHGWINGPVPPSCHPTHWQQLGITAQAASRHGIGRHPAVIHPQPWARRRSSIAGPWRDGTISWAPCIRAPSSPSTISQSFWRPKAPLQRRGESRSTCVVAWSGSTWRGCRWTELTGLGKVFSLYKYFYRDEVLWHSCWVCPTGVEILQVLSDAVAKS